MTAKDDRLSAPATERNREPIADVLRDILPTRGVVLEIASGTGQHVAFFAPLFPALVFQPSDPDPAHRASIAAWTEGLDNVRPPLALDTRVEPWPIESAAVVLCINMIHIAPISAFEALVRGAAAVLPPRGVLYTYGPYKIEGRHTADSNRAFDESLRTRNPEWGVRDIQELDQIAAQVGLRLSRRHPMPANNFSLVFEKSAPTVRPRFD